MSKEKKDQSGSDVDIFDSGEIVYLINERFRIKKKLGKGGMGEIFLAEDTKLKRLVAIKRISRENLTDKDSKIRFLREAQTASQIEHPNICPIYEIYEEEKNNYIVMQYIDGITLDNIIKYNELDKKKIVNICIQICDGMIEAHSVGIIHRDLKPQNVMIDKKGNIKLLDFGLAKFRDDSETKKHGISNSNLTEKGIVIGTVSYMSPEQAKGEPLDFRNDIFSFGVLMFEMIKGYNPFYDKEQITTLYNVLNMDVKFRDDSEPEMKALVNKCLEKKRENRFSSFEEIKNRLLEIKNDSNSAGTDRKEPGRTEIIDLHEKEEIMKEVGKSSSTDDLGDIVYRIKKIRTETVPVISTKKSYINKYLFFLLIVVIVGVILTVGGVFNSDSKKITSPPVQYIVLHSFSGDGSDLFKRKLSFLLKEGFDSVKGLKTTENETLPLVKNTTINKDSKSEVKGKFNINYDLNGNITKIKNIFNIDAILKYRPDGSKSSITVPGLDTKDSIINFQIKTLANRVIKKIFSKSNNKQVSIDIGNTYGKKWDNFDIFFRGLEFFKKFDIPSAKRDFLKSKDVPASSYYLANLFYFKGDRIRSRKIIQRMLPNLKNMSEIIRLNTLALKARLDLDFSNEIKYLTSLKNLNPLSKESFYELGEAFFHRGDAKNALKYYSGAINLDKNYSKALNHIGYCYSYLGDHDKSIEFFESYRDLDKSANSFDSLGDGYFYSGDLLASEASKLTALKIEEKGTYWAYLTLADIYLLKNRIGNSLDSADRYISIVKEPFEKAGGLCKKAFIFYFTGNNKKGLDFINKSLSVYDSEDLSNNSAEEHWLKGLLLVKTGKIEDAENELLWLKNIVKKGALSLNNYLAPLKYMYHLKAVINSITGNFSVADSSFRSLLELKYRLSYWITQYNYQFFLNEYAGFLFESGKIDESIAQVDKCLKLGGKYIPALWLKAEILEHLNKTDESLKIYKMLDSLYDSKIDKNKKSEILKKKIKNLSNI